MKKIYQFTTFHGLPLEASYYPSLLPTNKPVIIYFHGGGLIYGQRDDLPVPYIRQLTAAGYPLLTIDYPFIPEVRIPEIKAVLGSALTWFQEAALTELKLTSPAFIYFGRSAGAYLALLLAHSAKLPKPEKIIAFYGYYSLTETDLQNPSPYYQQFPAVPFMTVHQLIQKKPCFKALIHERFPLYLAYRQTGQWAKEITGNTATAADYSLTEDDLKQLPPTFVACSHQDKDVPPSISLKMAKLIPNSCLQTVTDLPHDFDSYQQESTGKATYTNLITWLDK